MVTTCSYRCTMAWLAGSFVMLKKYANVSRIGPIGCQTNKKSGEMLNQFFEKMIRIHASLIKRQGAQLPTLAKNFNHSYSYVGHLASRRQKLKDLFIFLFSYEMTLHQCAIFGIFSRSIQSLLYQAHEYAKAMSSNVNNEYLNILKKHLLKGFAYIKQRKLKGEKCVLYSIK